MFIKNMKQNHNKLLVTWRSRCLFLKSLCQFIWNAYLEILPGCGLAFPFLPEHYGSQNLQ